MGPQNQIILDDDVLEAVKRRAEAKGKTLDQATNDVVRLGLSEVRGQSVVKRERDYGREMRGAVSDEEAIQVAVDAVHESRAERRGLRVKRTGLRRVITSKAPRQPWHSRQLWQCGLWNLQILNDLTGFESHPPPHSPI
jgi:hypothetical protein